MKTLILIISFCLLISQDKGILTGIWKLIQYKDLKTDQILYEPEQYEGLECIKFEFEDDGIQGKFAGKTVNNKTRGEYNLYENNKIKVNSFGGTKAGEPKWGSDFWDAIRISSSYKKYNDTLIINYDNDSKAMIFIKRQN